MSLQRYSNLMDIYRHRQIRGDHNYRHTLEVLLETSFFVDNRRHPQKGLCQTGSNPTNHDDSEGLLGPEDLALSDNVLSTIAIAISPDGETIATSHGDHTIKVFLYHTGKRHRIFR